MSNKRFGTDRVTLALEFTPLVGQCPSGCTKCRTRTQAGDSKVPKQCKPEIATPEQREQLRALYEKRFPAPPPEASETLGSTFAFEKPQPEGEREEGSSSTEVIENARRLHRAHESHNETMKVCLDAERVCAQTVYVDRLVTECQKHRGEMAEERRCEFLKKHPRRER